IELRYPGLTWVIGEALILGGALRKARGGAERRSYAYLYKRDRLGWVADRKTLGRSRRDRLDNRGRRGVWACDAECVRIGANIRNANHAASAGTWGIDWNAWKGDRIRGRLEALENIGTPRTPVIYPDTASVAVDSAHTGTGFSIALRSADPLRLREGLV